MNIARTIDHTLLKPDATRENILSLCAEAREFAFSASASTAHGSRLRRRHWRARRFWLRR